jgi:DNA anti-recombination protein RmuC
MNDETRAALRERLGNIDQIRDILFGTQLREYSTRLEEVEKNLSLLHQEIRDRSDEVKQSLSKDIQSLGESLDKKFKSLALKDDEEKVDIRQQLDRLSKRLSSNVTTLDETIDKQTTALRDQLLSNHDELQSEIKILRNQIFEELDKRIAGLNQTKIARDDMAAILFEVGFRLKGTEFVPELRQVADSKDSNSSYLLTD